MNTFEKILKFLDAQMQTPSVFGWFHIMFIVIIAAITTGTCLLVKKAGNKEKAEKITRIVVLSYSIITILLEIYKQLNFSFDSATGKWEYSWYAFPFQFCSTPMYVGLIAGCLKKGKFQSYLYSYLATFALFAGLVVMIYPGDVFIGTIGINIQTMICHGGMVVVGAMLYCSGLIRMHSKTIVKAFAVFITLACLANIMNIIFHQTGNTATFNMFYISPYLPCTLPILNLVHNIAPYPIFLAVYLIGFLLASYVVLLIAIFSVRLKIYRENRLFRLKVKQEATQAHQ